METPGKYRVNCFECTRLKSKLGKRGEHTGWLCTKQGLTNSSVHELPYASPEAYVFAVFGVPLSVFVQNAQGELLPCRFLAKSKVNSWGEPSMQLIEIAKGKKH